MLASLKAQCAWRLAQVLWELRRGARAFSRGFGWWGWSLFLCVAAVVLASWAVHQQKVRTRVVQAQLLEQQAAKERAPNRLVVVAGADAAGVSDVDRLKAFEDYLLPHDDIPVVVQDLLSLAEDQGLMIQRGEYRPQIDQVGGFLRYRMSLPVKGAAPAIHRFMQAALRTQKTLALESVQFKRERIEATDVEARIQWVVLTQLPGHRPASLMAVDTASGGAR